MKISSFRKTGVPPKPGQIDLIDCARPVVFFNTDFPSIFKTGKNMIEIRKHGGNEAHTERIFLRGEDLVFANMHGDEYVLNEADYDFSEPYCFASASGIHVSLATDDWVHFELTLSDPNDHTFTSEIVPSGNKPEPVLILELESSSVKNAAEEALLDWNVF